MFNSCTEFLKKFLKYKQYEQNENLVFAINIGTFSFHLQNGNHFNSYELINGMAM